MDARAALALAALVFAGLSSGCNTPPCEVWQSWRNVSSPECLSCEAAACQMQMTTEARAAGSSACAPQFACAARCPAMSVSSCGCIDRCFTTDMCRTAYVSLYECEVANCNDACSLPHTSHDSGTTTH